MDGYSSPQFAIQMTCCRHHEIMIPPKLSLSTHFSDNADCFSSIQTKYNPELRSGLTRVEGVVSHSNFSNSAGLRLKAQDHLTAIFESWGSDDELQLDVICSLSYDWVTIEGPRSLEASSKPKCMDSSKPLSTLATWASSASALGCFVAQ